MLPALPDIARDLQISDSNDVQLVISLFILGTVFGELIFGNINAMSMEWLGGMAGIGNSVVGALSSSLAVVVAVLVGRLYDGTAFAVATCFTLVAIVSLWLLGYARRVPAVSL